MTRVIAQNGFFFIEGQIDELLDYRAFAGAARPLKVDLSRVINCNSIGIRDFLKFVQVEGPLGLEFHRCSAAAMDMINSIPSSLGKPPRSSIIKSLILNVRCYTCRLDHDTVVEIKNPVPGKVPPLPTITCKQCQTILETSTDPEDVFTYLFTDD